MTYSEIYNLVSSNNGKTFIITYNDNSKSVKRLFISTGNNVCEFGYRSRTRGRVIYTDNIVNVVVKESNNTEIRLCRNNLKNVIKYLKSSGLWKPMITGAEYFLSLDDETLLSMRTWEGYYKVMTTELSDSGVIWFGMDCFANLFKKPIKTANFQSYNRNDLKSRIADNLSKKENMNYAWRKKYDNSIEIKFGEDYARGWYSEEYKNCGNGHYYFLLDNCHVLYCEDD